MSDSPKQSASSAAIRSPGPLESPILSFDLNAEIERLRGENAWQGGRNSKTLVKHPDFRVMLTVLKSNARLHEHKAAGGISVQAIGPSCVAFLRSPRTLLLGGAIEERAHGQVTQRGSQ